MRLLAYAVCAVLTAAATPLAAQELGPTYLYDLDPESRFEAGCFGPCLCPILMSDALSGSMKVVGSDVIDPGNPVLSFAVRDVRWKFPRGTQTVDVRGSGVYQIDQGTNQHQLQLDLSVDGGPLQRFDSGLVPHTGKDRIDIDISLHGEFCFDTVMRVRSTRRTADVGEGTATLSPSAAPNPFGGGTEIAFTAPEAGPVEVRVLDLAGRQVAVLARGWRGAGRVSVAWDGRRSDGRLVPAGVYVVRIDAAGRRATLRVGRVP